MALYVVPRPTGTASLGDTLEDTFSGPTLDLLDQKFWGQDQQSVSLRLPLDR